MAAAPTCAPKPALSSLVNAIFSAPTDFYDAKTTPKAPSRATNIASSLCYTGAIIAFIYYYMVSKNQYVTDAQVVYDHLDGYSCQNLVPYSLTTYVSGTSSSDNHYEYTGTKATATTRDMCIAAFAAAMPALYVKCYDSSGTALYGESSCSGYTGCGMGGLSSCVSSIMHYYCVHPDDSSSAVTTTISVADSSASATCGSSKNVVMAGSYLGTSGSGTQQGKAYSEMLSTTTSQSTLAYEAACTTLDEFYPFYCTRKVYPSGLTIASNAYASSAAIFGIIAMILAFLLDFYASRTKFVPKDEAEGAANLGTGGHATANMA